jgi:deoxyribose-phosphate aldolase
MLSQRASRRAALAEAGLLSRPSAEAIPGIIDHTLLKASMVTADVERLCKEAIDQGFAAVCIPSAWISVAAASLKGTAILPACVIGFPLGAIPTQVKVSETLWAIKNGAMEIDAMINVGWLKEGRKDLVLAEMQALRQAVPEGTLKIILETPLLTNEEKVIAVRLAAQAGVDFVKTCTGFAGAATLFDVALLKSVAGEDLKVKASGGIRTEAQALAMMAVGADRIGTSNGLDIVGGHN